MDFSWIEGVGTLAALVYLYFSVNQKIWLWPMGILTSAFYMAVFFDARLYADMILQVYYLVVSVVGWIIWRSRQLNEHKETTRILKTTKNRAALFLLAFGLLYGLLTFLLITVPPMLNIAASDMPYWDAFTTAASFVATWMLAKKYIEQWLIWIVVDFVSMGMYIYKGLYITVILFAIYTVMAVWGYFAWLSHLKTQQKTVQVI
ncbi:nicotinamide mononucleotide transporter [Saccharicrinis carchari]|uniref:Nicotinamide riboside transporter PnuC n=1 Tax=Saccharicrinis carchari TaxID=1168039 RepID=A0A521E0I4_SACCC|nr:nicotinamide riboside transporter PnuC [Saccharicrinis carchari]SMO77464.1 nicotinamide mononucleotide transporter [Saccharicrinis carchari]